MKSIRARLLGIVAFLVDGLFFVLWLVVNFAIEEVRRFTNPAELDLVVFRVLQVLFALATIFPVMWDLWDDIRSRMRAGGDDHGN